MGKPNSAPQVGLRHDPERHGNWAQIGTMIIAILAFLISAGSLYFNVASRHSEQESRAADEHVNILIDAKLIPVNSKLENLVERLSSVEGEIKGFLAQKHIEESKTYAKEGKTALAVKAIQEATGAFSSASERRLPQPPSYFVDTIELIDGIARVSSSPGLSSSLQSARLSLAQYRSSLQVGTITYRGKIELLGRRLAVANRARALGGYFDASKLAGDIAVLAPGYRLNDPDPFTFEGTIFSGGSQTLDGIRWVGVTFIGTKIRYNGGPVVLDHVTFIGCTFAAPDNERGARFAEYAALMLPTFAGS